MHRPARSSLSLCCDQLPAATKPLLGRSLRCQVSHSSRKPISWAEITSSTCGSSRRRPVRDRPASSQSMPVRSRRAVLRPSALASSRQCRVSALTATRKIGVRSVRPPPLYPRLEPLWTPCHVCSPPIPPRGCPRSPCRARRTGTPRFSSKGRGACPPAITQRSSMLRDRRQSAATWASPSRSTPAQARRRLRLRHHHHHHHHRHRL